MKMSEQLVKLEVIDCVGRWIRRHWGSKGKEERKGGGDWGNSWFEGWRTASWGSSSNFWRGEGEVGVI